LDAHHSQQLASVALDDISGGIVGRLASGQDRIDADLFRFLQSERQKLRTQPAQPHFIRDLEFNVRCDSGPAAVRLVPNADATEVAIIVDKPKLALRDAPLSFLPPIILSFCDVLSRSG